MEFIAAVPLKTLANSTRYLQITIALAFYISSLNINDTRPGALNMNSNYRIGGWLYVRAHFLRSQRHCHKEQTNEGYDICFHYYAGI